MSIRVIERRNSGFSMAEILVALALLAILATFAIPKLLDTNANSELTAKIRSTFATVGEMYLSFQESDRFGQTGSLRNEFLGYLRQNINFLDICPAVAGAADPPAFAASPIDATTGAGPNCTADGYLFLMKDNTRIIRIASGQYTNTPAAGITTDTIEVTVEIPHPAGVFQYNVVMPFVGNAEVTRYTTDHGLRPAVARDIEDDALNIP